MNGVTEKHLRDNLFHDYEVTPIVEKWEFTAGTYKRGQLLEKHTDGKLQACTTADKLFAICTDDVVINSEVTKATAYMTGCFNASAIVDTNTLQMKDLKEHGRKYQIYFK